MKYMGSKAALLRGDLGRIVLAEAENAGRFVDSFAGSAAVGHFVAERRDVPVLSVDLQVYSAVLSGAIIERTESRSDAPVVTDWTKEAGENLKDSHDHDALSIDLVQLDKPTVLRARAEAEDSEDSRFITRHYGGHYFSPQQAFALDELYTSLPKDGNDRQIGLAALLRTASQVAAAPGHTAQPFQPSTRLMPYIRQAWGRDVLTTCQRHVEAIAGRHAKVTGRAITQDALSLVETLGEDDLVFCDPPYSAVQYSRFYHVLEGIAVGGWASVHGAGRAPSHEVRASSDFSRVSAAKTAMETMLEKLCDRRCTVIITFPDADASNGLSAEEISAIASRDWLVENRLVKSTHSTLGGSSSTGSRGGRRTLEEAVITLRPRG